MLVTAEEVLDAVFVEDEPDDVFVVLDEVNYRKRKLVIPHSPVQKTRRCGFLI